MKAALLHRSAFTPPAPAPDPLTRAQADALSDSARKDYAQQVRRWLNGHYFDSDRDRVIRAFLNRLIRDNAEALVGTRDVALLHGPNVIGKSTLLYQLAYALHRFHVGCGADPDVPPVRTCIERIGGRPEEIIAPYAPVVLISLDSATTVNKFDELLVEALDYDRSVAKKARYLDLLLRHGTRLLIIDDLHQLTATEKLGRQALDHLKAVVTALGEYGITVIFAGANLHTHPVMDDPQVTGRAYELTMNPYHADTDEAALAWQRFLKESGDLLTPHLPATRPGSLHNELPGLLLARTHGRMRETVHLLREATVNAIEDGTWAITDQHIHAVRTAKLTQDQTRDQQARSRKPATSLHPTVGLTQPTGTGTA